MCNKLRGGCGVCGRGKGSGAGGEGWLGGMVGGVGDWWFGGLEVGEGEELDRVDRGEGMVSARLRR